MHRRWAWGLGVICLVAACRGESTEASQGGVTVSATLQFGGGQGSSIEATTLKGAELHVKLKSTHSALTASSMVDRYDLEPSSGLLFARTDAPRFQEAQALVGIPMTAAHAMTVESRGIKVSVTPRSFADSKVEWSERLAIYPSVQDGVHAFRRVAWDGVEDFYQVENTRDELTFSYDVAMTNVAGLRLVGGTLEMLDAAGTPRVRSTTPVAIDAHGVERAGEIEVSGCAYDTSPLGPWNRPLTRPGSSTCTVTMRIDGRGLAYPVLVDPAWIGTYNTKQTHAYHKMFVLPAASPDAGKVLLVGGTGSAAQATELFDPSTNSWASSSLTGDASGFGQGTNAAMLSDGRVLLAGGFPTTGTTTVARASAVLRKTDGTWIAAAALSSGRAWHTMNVVSTGGKEYILVAGGQPQSTLSSIVFPSKTTEIYDPALDAWKLAGAMSLTRTHGGSAVLSDGRVLVAGGDTQSTTCCTYLTATTSTDIFDPSTSTWSAGPALKSAREYPMVVALAGGSGPLAVVAGGYQTLSPYSINTLETLDSGATTWTLLTPTLSTGRVWSTAEKLSDGRVLFIGGNNTSTGTATPTDTTDLYNPTAGTVVASSIMATVRMNAASASLGAKGVLVTGGLISTSVGSETTLSELYDTTIGAPCTTTCGGGLTCTDGVCCTRASCPEGQTCSAPGHEGVCTKAKGAACAANTECATGFCVTGFCCESSCGSGCKSCAIPGKEGTCVLATAGTDPGAFCAAGASDPACGRKCDGTGKCSSTYPTGTPCGASLSDAGAPFCTTNTCSGFGTCSTTTNNCGLTCTTSVTCNESTKTCTALASGVLAGYCVIDSTCYTYGDIDPKDPCHVCDPPTSKTSWSTALSCTDGGVDDTGVDDTGVDDTGTTADTGPRDTGSTADSGGDAGDDTATSDDTGTPEVDSGSPVDNELPSSSACSCHLVGGEGEHGDEAPIGLALVALGAVVVVRRRASRA
jgi:hypothetical protein